MAKVSPKRTTIGWIGTGVMGSPMCLHLIKKHYKAIVNNRTKRKAKQLIDNGAKWAQSPKAVAENADVIFTIVGFPKDVRQVYFGKDGIIEGLKKGSVLVDMTTTEPSLAEEIYEEARRKGASSVDAPVSGGDIGAQAGTLSIMVGGDKDAVNTVMPLLKFMGENIVHQGGAGKGQHAKMCNQIMASALMIGMCETLLYGYKAGLDLNTMLSSVSKGAAASWMLDNLAPRIVKRDFKPGFYVEHFIKDMGIALKEAERMNLMLPGLSLVNQLYIAAKAQGHGRKGTQALLLALEKISDVK
ncbi:MAG: NAD(P)-dependent oxidoreductase [Candidatus Dadabacteria bacterium]|nr:NAD(P)-dependent oxidoreductase [Candidatus Dadabacteria bacterium]MCH7950878.1 NAD(P)-dependent oxidoreductase [Candidatus Dadabacteria bacterium]